MTSITNPPTKMSVTAPVYVFKQLGRLAEYHPDLRSIGIVVPATNDKCLLMTSDTYMLAAVTIPRVIRQGNKSLWNDKVLLHSRSNSLMVKLGYDYKFEKETFVKNEYTYLGYQQSGDYEGGYRRSLEWAELKDFLRLAVSPQELVTIDCSDKEYMKLSLEHHDAQHICYEVKDARHAFPGNAYDKITDARDKAHAPEIIKDQPRVFMERLNTSFLADACAMFRAFGAKDFVLSMVAPIYDFEPVLFESKTIPWFQMLLMPMLLEEGYFNAEYWRIG